MAVWGTLSFIRIGDCAAVREPIVSSAACHSHHRSLNYRQWREKKWNESEMWRFAINHQVRVICVLRMNINIHNYALCRCCVDEVSRRVNLHAISLFCVWRRLWHVRTGRRERPHNSPWWTHAIDLRFIKPFKWTTLCTSITRGTASWKRYFFHVNQFPFAKVSIRQKKTLWMITLIAPFAIISCSPDQRTNMTQSKRLKETKN